MADAKKNEAKKEVKDPIVDRSLAPHFVIFTGLLLLSTAWLVVDEFWIRREYKPLQTQFIELAQKKALVEVDLYKAQLAEQKESDAWIEANDALTEWTNDEELQAEIKKLGDRRHEIEGELSGVRRELQFLAGDYQPMIYAFEHAVLEGKKAQADRLLKEMEEQEGKISPEFDKFIGFNQEKAKIADRILELSLPANEARARMGKTAPATGKLALAKQWATETPSYFATVTGAFSGNPAPRPPFDKDIKQIYNPALDVVDRCQSCHVATDMVGFTKGEWQVAFDQKKLNKEELDRALRVFSSHPNLGSTDPQAFDAFAAHPVDKFGCTTCHAGNGPATVATKAHGTAEGDPKDAWLDPRHYELYPMLPIGSAHFGNMFEAGCNKCHDHQQYLFGAEQLTLGRELVEDVGCVGCHKIKGYRVDESERDGLQNDLKDLAQRYDAAIAQQRYLKSEGEDTTAVNQTIASLGADTVTASKRLSELNSELKWIGPDLNAQGQAGLKSKIYTRWLPRWIADPHEFRPSTRMPNPLLAVNDDPMKDEVLQVAAYIWQQAGGTPTDAEAPKKFPAATIQEGRWLTNTVGCTACHRLEDGGATDDIEALRPKAIDETAESFMVYDIEAFWTDKEAKLKTTEGVAKGERAPLVKRGETFGPSLATIGEKVRYEWLVAWLLDPRGLMPHSSMPSLRLSQQEAEKIAAFLTTLREGDKPGGERYGEVPIEHLNDPRLAALGQRHLLRYGCNNCHAIDLRKAPADPSNPGPLADWERMGDPGKIGVELSAHGTKPLPLFDFGHLHLPHFRNAWMQTKVLEPRSFDTAKYKGNPNDRLIMPRFGLTVEEAQAVVTVLSGQVNTPVPGQYEYDPSGAGAAIIKGERVLKKYNCRSCHEINDWGGLGQDALTASIIEALSDEALSKKQITGPAILSPTDYMPPTLNNQGVRTRPEWLFHFLKDPGAIETPEG
ncbi:MAG: cytochrome c3 family protein, partial [Planctomycetota bacterium]